MAGKNHIVQKSIVAIMGWLLFLTISCEEPLDVVLPTGPTLLVVEGWVTDQPGPYQVKVTTTDNFNSNRPTPRVSQALVTITDDLGQEISLKESTPGIYYTDSIAFRGEVGRAYQLAIILLNGNRYQSDFQVLKSVTPIDSLTYYFIPDPFPNNEEPDGEGYYVITSLTDPDPTGDFYRWKVARNQEYFDLPEDLRIETDRFVNGNPFTIDFDDFDFEVGDTCKIQQMSITEDAFDFLRLLTIQAIEIGQSTSTSPSIVIGNMRSTTDPEEVVLGFFGTSSVVEESVIIEALN